MDINMDGGFRIPGTENLIKVVSFNLKRDGLFSGKNRWMNRCQAAARLIRDSGAAIIGVQELLPSMKADVQNLLSKDYSILGTGRLGGNNPKNDEHSDIIVKNRDVEVNYVTTFWLSKTPDKTASKAYFSFFPRICTVAEVHIKSIDRKIRVFNTHFDHISPIARTVGVYTILDHMNRFNQINPLPSILMGDMNAKPSSKAIQILRNNRHFYSTICLKDIYSTFQQSDLCNTFHNFSGKRRIDAKPIDYIFISEDFEIVDSAIITQNYDGRYPSDHFPLTATLRLKPAF